MTKEEITMTKEEIDSWLKTLQDSIKILKEESMRYHVDNGGNAVELVSWNYSQIEQAITELTKIM